MSPIVTASCTCANPASMPGSSNMPGADEQDHGDGHERQPEADRERSQRIEPEHREQAECEAVGDPDPTPDPQCHANHGDHQHRALRRHRPASEQRIGQCGQRAGQHRSITLRTERATTLPPSLRYARRPTPPRLPACRCACPIWPSGDWCRSGQDPATAHGSTRPAVRPTALPRCRWRAARRARLVSRRRCARERRAPGGAIRRASRALRCARHARTRLRRRSHAAAVPPGPFLRGSRIRVAGATARRVRGARQARQPRGVVPGELDQRRQAGGGVRSESKPHALGAQLRHRRH